TGLPIQELIDASCDDPDFKLIRGYLKSSWPPKKDLPHSIRPYFDARNSLSVEDDMLVKKDIICVPLAMQTKILQLLHSGHPGTVRMQQQYRSYYYWPGGSQTIREFCQECEPCRRSDSAKPQETVPVGAIPPPDKPWSELSLDITGPFSTAPEHQRFAVVVQDYFSKYPVVLLTGKITSSIIIKWLKKVFSLFGNLLKIRSDNGPQFISEEFKSFLADLNIHHDLSPNYSPQSNGLVEVFNRFLKRGIQKFNFQSDRGTFDDKLDELLVHFRSTAPENGKSPAEMLFGWRLRPSWDIFNHFLVGRGKADVDPVYEKTFEQLDLEERQKVAKKKFESRKYGLSDGGSRHPYFVGDWVTVKL
ncbi:MAG: transposase family protein, partial [Desulfobacterales bacterium]|nr:transposase family protein [Desulfobacterales bacterium]